TSLFRAWGPEGTLAMKVDMEKAFDADIRVRSTALNVAIDAKDVTVGVVFQENGVRVEAFTVAHGDLTASGFRVDYPGHSVVLAVHIVLYVAMLKTIPNAPLIFLFVILIVEIQILCYVLDRIGFALYR